MTAILISVRLTLVELGRLNTRKAVIKCGCVAFRPLADNRSCESSYIEKVSCLTVKPKRHTEAGARSLRLSSASQIPPQHQGMYACWKLLKLTVSLSRLALQNLFSYVLSPPPSKLPKLNRKLRKDLPALRVVGSASSSRSSISVRPTKRSGLGSASRKRCELHLRLL